MQMKQFVNKYKIKKSKDQLKDEALTRNEERRCRSLKGTPWEQESPKSMFKNSMAQLNRLLNAKEGK